MQRARARGAHNASRIGTRLPLAVLAAILAASAQTDDERIVVHARNPEDRHDTSRIRYRNQAARDCSG